MANLLEPKKYLQPADRTLRTVTTNKIEKPTFFGENKLKNEIM